MNTLPVASTKEVRSHARRIALRYPRQLATVLVLNVLAAASGLAMPWLLGDLVASVARDRSEIAHYVLLICLACVVQALLIKCAMYAAAGLGEKVLAELRQEFVHDLLALELNTVENADRGDLVTRTTRDVGTLSTTVRHAIPETLIAVVTIMITLGALLLISPLLVLPCLISAPILFAASKWYVSRARAGYLRQSASYSQLTEGLTETVEGAHTVEALQLSARRLERVDRDIAESYAAERYTLRLRNVFLPICDTTYVLPVAASLIIGGLFYIHGMVTLAEVTAATLYIQQLLGPVDTLLFWLNELQMSGVALARLLGIAESAPPATDLHKHAPDTPDIAGNDSHLVVRDVRYAYRTDVDVLHGIDLDIVPGERLAIVGPSGSGKSTLGQLLAGIHRPRTGSITLDGLPLAEIPLEDLRGRVAIVAQDHHVFDGSLRDNLVIAKSDATDREIEAALAAVDAEQWAAQFGLDTRISLHQDALTPAQTQQITLARLVLANPHTLILDEATAFLDPRSARQVERSLSVILKDRTVIAIAHRLHTAHDADRIAVMEEGRITELGTHHELLERGGAYADLWNTWQGSTESLTSRTTVHRP
ncbi:ABC transporter ATP-binding protein [Streptomyces phaeochromogenes]|uniref:ABC transporter ATP-binding protein n=1 Tax=Streptomyces phaeochromogenes TaxID=1923 RepID=UPI0036AC457D